MINIFSIAFFLGIAGLLTSCNNGATTDDTSDAPSSVEYPESELGWKLGAHSYTFRSFTFFEAIDKIDTPGASEVGSHLFVLKMLDDCYEKDVQDKFVTGNNRSLKKNGNNTDFPGNR